MVGLRGRNAYACAGLFAGQARSHRDSTNPKSLRITRPPGTAQTPKLAQYPLPQEQHKPQSLHSTCGSGLAREEARTDLEKLRRDAA